MSRLAARAKNVVQPPAVVSPAQNTVRALFDRIGDLEPLVARRISNSTKIFQTWTLNPVKADYVRAIERCDILPSSSDLAVQVDRLYAATYTAASEDETSFIIATMLDAIPTAAARLTATYVDALVWAALHADDARDPEALPRYRGFSPEALASAARHIWLTVKYAPAIAELVDAASEARDRLFLALNTTRRLTALRQNAEAVIEAVEAAEPIPEDPDEIPF